MGSNMKTDSRVDIWSIGVLFLILLSGKYTIVTNKTAWFVSSKLASEEKNKRNNLHFVTLHGLEFVNKLVRYKF